MNKEQQIELQSKRKELISQIKSQNNISPAAEALIKNGKLDRRKVIDMRNYAESKGITLDNKELYNSIESPYGNSGVNKQIQQQTEEEFEKLNQDGRIYWGKNGDSVPSIKIFENEPRETNTSSIFDSNNMTTTKGTNDFGAIMNFSDEEFLIAKEMRPKPTALIQKLVHIGAGQDDIILDFFAGSGTTAQAVMELNAEDGGNRRFILVQLPEEIKEDKNKTAYRCRTPLP